MNLKSFKAVLFDFDGVIVDSVRLKVRAFEEMFQRYGEEIVEKVREHTMLHGGISRKEKIPYYFAEYVGAKLSAEESELKAEEYAALVKERVVEAPLVPGVLEFVEQIRGEKRTAIVTGTPQGEIEYIVDKRNMRYYFDAICGSPDHKTEIITRLLNSWEIRPEQALFIGDSWTDYRAAFDTGVVFLLRTTVESQSYFTELDLPQFQDYRELFGGERPVFRPEGVRS